MILDLKWIVCSSSLKFECENTLCEGELFELLGE